jgi:hypothetical protein
MMYHDEFQFDCCGFIYQWEFHATPGYASGSVDAQVVGFTTTHAISAYHHSCQGVLDISLCDKVCQRLATG